MEIRAKVTEYVRLRIVAARKESPGSYENCSVLRTNSMKYLPNYFAKGSIHKLFFCFPDPHFKRKNHPRRIISERLLSEYAYVLQPGGRLYCITDVLELHEWHVAKCNGHALFRKITDDSILKDDPCVKAMKEETEEGKKVSRNKGSKYFAVYERIEDDQALQLHSGNFF
jgi:tRNA (guanine-N7-)-methyltransferase